MNPLILIVDDKPEIAKVISMFLRQWYRTEYCRNGVDALARLSQGELPSLIVSDVNMPDMDGYELLRRLKSSDRLAQIPLFVLSSIESSADRIALLEMGAADFLLKPFNPEELRLRIKRLI